MFTDRHALLQTARFSAALGDLPHLVDWQLLQSRDFVRDPDDPGKLERYQAEALAYDCVPAGALTGVVCSAADQVGPLQAQVHDRGLAATVIARPEWFYL